MYAISLPLIKTSLKHWSEQITFNTTVKLTKTDERTIRSILASCVYIELIFDNDAASMSDSEYRQTTQL